MGDEREDSPTLRNQTSSPTDYTFTKSTSPTIPRWAWLLSMAIVVVVVFYVRGNAPDVRREFTLDVPQTFVFDNLTAIRVDPGRRSVEVEWSGYNKQSASPSDLPYEVVRFSSGAESYVVSTQDSGDDALQINGRAYQFDADTRQLLISFGYGVMAEQRGNYGAASRPDSLP